MARVEDPNSGARALRLLKYYDTHINSEHVDTALRELALEYVDDLDTFEEFLDQFTKTDGDVTRIVGLTHEPVSVDTFIDDEYFLGLRHNVYDEVRSAVKQILEGGYIEALLMGAIGVGKTTAAQIVQAYHLYLLSCEKWPQLRFGLMPTTTIYIAMLNRTDQLAQAVTFGEFRNMLERVPYFRENYPADAFLKSQLVFPKGNIIVQPAAAYATKLLGMNVIGGIIDEMNFMQKITKSKQSADGGGFDQAKSIYGTLVRRRKSRFLQYGKLPGCLCLVSSKGGPEDFTEQRLQEVEAEAEGLTFVWDKAQWEVVPSERFSGEKFLVEIGDERHNSRVIPAYDMAREGARVIEVPVEFRADFDRDMEGSLRDYAGISTLSKKPFFYDREKVWLMAENFEKMGLVSPLLVHEHDLSRGLPPIRPGYQVPNPDRMRVAHIDLGLKNDSCGLAVGYVYDVTTVRSRGEDGSMVLEDLPVVAYDLALTIRPPRGGEIDFDLVRQVLYLLRDRMKIPLKWVSFDQFQSVDSRQILRKRGFQTDYVSVDGKQGREVYRGFRTAVFNERVLCPENPIAFHELASLEEDHQKGVIDHTAQGSKDTADAMAGVFSSLMKRRATWKLANQTGGEGPRRPNPVRPAGLLRRSGESREA